MQWFTTDPRFCESRTPTVGLQMNSFIVLFLQENITIYGVEETGHERGLPEGTMHRLDEERDYQARFSSVLTINVETSLTITWFLILASLAPVLFSTLISLGSSLNMIVGFPSG